MSDEEVKEIIQHDIKYDFREKLTKLNYVDIIEILGVKRPIDLSFNDLIKDKIYILDTIMSFSGNEVTKLEAEEFIK
jgi:hypothetical protein